jgi:hypothetical protein
MTDPTTLQALLMAAGMATAGGIFLDEPATLRLDSPQKLAPRGAALGTSAASGTPVWYVLPLQWIFLAERIKR